MRILFWGTPEFAVPSLRALDDEGFEIVAVVTQPDRPAGRGRRLKSSAIKQVADDLGIDVLAPESPREADFLERIRELAPDISVVVAYGHILKPEVLAIPRLGSINVHASLLPKLRGAAPINWAIARGDDLTGITIMRMTEGMDAGPIVHQVTEPILPDESAAELSIRLSEIGAEALVEALALLSADAAEEVEQDHAAATLAPKIDRQTARIDWTRPAAEVSCHIRAMDDAPGAWSMLDGEAVKLFRSTVTDEETTRRASPGTVVQADGGVVVAAGEGSVCIAEVQPPGGRRMRATDWVHGHRIEPGQRFE